MTLSSFRAQPRVGHLERVKRVYAYLINHRHYRIRFDVKRPNHDHTPVPTHDWSNTAYGNGVEKLPDDAPALKGETVVLTHYYDANLMHDILSGKSVSGIFHLANLTPVMWHSKKQAPSKTATYGAEFFAGRTCIEQVVDLRHSFRYLGAPVHEVSYVFGDNKSQIKSSSIPYTKLNKRYNILSYHYVRSMVAKGFINLLHIKSGLNLADTLSKHWSHRSNYENLIRPLLNYYSYDTDRSNNSGEIVVTESDLEKYEIVIH